MADKEQDKSDANVLTTGQFFDKTFKRIFGNVSHHALVAFINGGFGSHHAPESPVAFQPTESIIKTETGAMKRETSDMILTIGGKAYVIEAQTADDETIALRVFEYGLSYALKGRTIIDNGELVEVTLLRGMVIYWESSGKTPDKTTFRVKTPDGRALDYEIKVLKVLSHELSDLDQRNLSLLYPFYLLKVRKEVKKGPPPERLQELAGITEGIEREIVSLLTKAQADGRLTAGDVFLIQDLMLDTHERLYGDYPPFEEVYKQMDDELRTPNFDRYKELERQYAQQAAQAIAAAEHEKQAVQQRAQAAEQEVANLRRQLAAYQAAQPAARPMA
jgi:hypothetical protein